MKRIAVAHLVLPEGMTVHNQVLCIEAEKVQRYYLLQKEEPNTSWYGGTAFLHSDGSVEFE